MQQKVLKQTPGVIVGMSTTQGYNGVALFYDGDKQILEVDLIEPMPSVQTKTGLEPGLDIDLFCKKSIRVAYPKHLSVEFFTN